ncbi:uncharacterized protein LOC116528479 [Sapajus apella]|uniref:Uncharacterized protein LOC116528479 n=1 Tax=Sapajus apella TaxID=9515 RepID=A0A6J3F7E5_SAPAP|nr:uncharacterized protein LOC116528479 [Sapajus apella]XP_032101579.1 uncharacterized protein LOC116528479 [Sapajus apella]
MQLIHILRNCTNRYPTEMTGVKFRMAIACTPGEAHAGPNLYRGFHCQLKSSLRAQITYASTRSGFRQVGKARWSAGSFPQLWLLAGGSAPFLLAPPLSVAPPLRPANDATTGNDDTGEGFRAGPGTGSPGVRGFTSETKQRLVWKEPELRAEVAAATAAAKKRVPNLGACK